jgi:hypothetical protein
MKERIHLEKKKEMNGYSLDLQSFLYRLNIHISFKDAWNEETKEMSWDHKEETTAGRY